MVDTVGTIANEALTGTNDADQITGMGGSDTLDGLGGNDILNGDGVENGIQTTSGSATIPTTSQTIALNLNAPDISGAASVWINGLVSNTAVSSTTINVAIVMDVSGSTGSTGTGLSVGDLNGDGANNTILDGEIGAVDAILNSLIDDVNAPDANVGLIGFSSSASLIGSAVAAADTNGNNTYDITDAAATQRSGGGTDFEAALQSAVSYFQGKADEANYLFFLSDGYGYGSYTDELQTLAGLNTTIRAIGVGGGASLPQLQTIDANAVVVTDLSALNATIVTPPVQAADIDYLEVTLNGQVVETIDASALTSTALGLRYETRLSGLDTEADDDVSVRVVASDVDGTVAVASQTIENPGIDPDAGDDVLRGGDGEDTLSGGDGNDSLYGEGNDDVLFGGRGADVFYFSATGGGNDAIYDFEVGIDRIVVDGVSYGDITITPGPDGEFILSWTDGDPITVELNPGPPGSGPGGALSTGDLGVAPADLRYMDDLIQDDTLAPGQDLVMDLLVGNVGEDNATAITTFYWSADDTLDGGDTVVATFDHGMIDGGVEVDSQDITIAYDVLEPLGDGFIIPVLDAAGAVDEADEANNTGPARSFSIDRADLTISAISLSHTDISDRDNFRAFITVANEGSTEAAGATTFYYSADMVLDANDTALGVDTHGTLDAGDVDDNERLRIYTDDVLAASGTDLTGYIIAKIDADDSVAETDEANNVIVSEEITLRVVETPADDADLVIESLTTRDADLALGEDLFLRAAIANTGGTDAGKSATTYYWSATDTFDSATAVEIGSDNHGSLDAGERDGNESTRIRFEAVEALGSGYVFGVIDAADEIAEGDEANNVSDALAITVAADTDAADLSVTMSVANVDLAAGEDLEITLEASNTGTVTARGTMTTIYWSADATFDAGDVQIGTDGHGSLSAGEVDDNEGLDVDYAALAFLGDGFIFAKIDATDSVSESDEDNNVSAAIAITVDSADDADLMVTDMRVVDGRLRDGEDFFVYLDVENNGDTDARSVETAIFWNPTDVFDEAQAEMLASDHHGLLRAGERESDERTRIRYEAVEHLGDGFIFARIDNAGDIDEINDLDNLFGGTALDLL